MFAYDNPRQSPYWSILQKSFGAASGTVSYRLKGPQGCRGLVRDILVDVTAAMVGTTSVPEVQVGAAAGTTGAAAVDYARFRLGTAAGAGYDTSSGNALRARSLVAGNPTPPALSDFAGHIALESAFIPKDTPFFITLVEGVGGTPAGAASIYLFVDWF